MNVSSTTLGRLMSWRRPWLLELTADAIRIGRGREPVRSVPLSEVQSITSVPGLLGSTISLTTSERTTTHWGLVPTHATAFIAAVLQEIKQQLLKRRAECQRRLQVWDTALDRLLQEPRYISNFDVEAWRTRDGDLHSALATAATINSNPHLRAEAGRETLHRLIERLTHVATGSRDEITTRNSRFVDAEIKKHRAFFDSIESKPLTPEQRVASVVLQDRNLLVAAAGSGKTSTIVAKTGYSLLTKQYAPSELLVLAFNNDAAGELDQRINEKLSSLLPAKTKVRCSTFHALGLAVIANGRGVKPSVAKFATGSEVESSRFMEGLIGELLRTDMGFAVNWLIFRALYGVPAKPLEDFKTRREWEEYVRAIGDYKEGRRGFQTLKGDLVKSQGELAIANWLFSQGVPYEYERPYEHPTATEQYRQYSPDFYFPEIRAYLEHYGIDSRGNPPPAFAERYRESMEWKATLHTSHQTDLITTTFGEFVEGTLFPKLKEELKKRGQKFSPVDLREVLAKLDAARAPEHISLLKSFLKQAKSNEVDKATLEKRAAQTSQPQRARVFIRVFWKIFEAYQAKLKAAGEVDFEDMILEAARLLEQGRAKHNYRLILVDEFQDISQARARLLKALLKQIPDCKFFAVGDDWQSVYRFAGADIDLFTSFPSHFGVTATNQLTATFRSNTGISNVASHFVQKNPKQLKKSIVAQDKDEKAVVVLRRYANLAGQDEECLAALSEIAKGTGPAARKKPTVFLLARYWHQCPAEFEAWRTRFKGTFDLSFKTVHSSKGLEADYVVVMGLASGRFSFPSTIADDPLFELVMPMPEHFEHAEERRLFYVAMTRARRRVYLLAHSAAPSPFVTEVFADKALRSHLRIDAPTGTRQQGAESCPDCGTGTLRRRSGKFGEFLGCSNYPICRFSKNL